MPTTRLEAYEELLDPAMDCERCGRPSFFNDLHLPPGDRPKYNAVCDDCFIVLEIEWEEEQCEEPS